MRKIFFLAVGQLKRLGLGFGCKIDTLLPCLLAHSFQGSLAVEIYFVISLHLELNCIELNCFSTSVLPLRFRYGNKRHRSPHGHGGRDRDVAKKCYVHTSSLAGNDSRRSARSKRLLHVQEDQ